MYCLARLMKLYDIHLQPQRSSTSAKIFILKCQAAGKRHGNLDDY